jgi:hypothetical protein
MNQVLLQLVLLHMLLLLQVLLFQLLLLHNLLQQGQLLLQLVLLHKLLQQGQLLLLLLLLLMLLLQGLQQGQLLLLLLLQGLQQRQLMKQVQVHQEEVPCHISMQGQMHLLAEMQVFLPWQGFIQAHVMQQSELAKC